jgi:hypothetical protein
MKFDFIILVTINLPLVLVSGFRLAASFVS